VQELPVDPTLCVAWVKREGLAGATELYIASNTARMLSKRVRTPERSLLGPRRWVTRPWPTPKLIGGAPIGARPPGCRCRTRHSRKATNLACSSWRAITSGDAGRHAPGPWVEEYRLPPWSSDYHFNINVQECYWPAYAGNQLRSLEPLWELLHSWEPKLRANARVFLGIEDGLMLNHAVDDRGVGMGGFWTVLSTMAPRHGWPQLMWQYYLYSLDDKFLAETAYPFMRGTMRVYEKMLEEARTVLLPCRLASRPSMVVQRYRLGA